MIETADLQNVIVDGLPLGVFLVKARIDMLTNELLPEGCKDREKFEQDFQVFLSAVELSVDKQKLKARPDNKLAVPEGAQPSGLIVP